MATVLSEAMNAQGMSVAIFCGGQSYVGVGISGTWAGTVSFEASTDGINFKPVSLTPFASGTAVSSITANGNYLTPVLNYVAVRAKFSARTSGTAVAKVATSIDSSWQDAFLASTSQYVNQESSANATNTVTIAAQANRAWRLKTLVVSFRAGTPASNKTKLTISDGASSVLWQVSLPLTETTTNVPIPAGGLVNTPGNTLVIAQEAAGGSIITNINAEISAA